MFNKRTFDIADILVYVLSKLFEAKDSLFLKLITVSDSRIIAGIEFYFQNF